VTEAERGLRVAIVGAGPRGLFALERLTGHAARSAVPLTVDVYDPTPVPGAGPVYDPDQPSFLRMNLVARHVDAWWPDHGAVPTELRLPFVRWCAEYGRRVGEDDGLAEYPADDDYVPRALVGRYLRDAFALVERSAPPSVRLRVRRAAVTAIEPADERWRVVSDGGDARSYDELLVTGGHRSSDRRALRHGWTYAAPLVPGVFPVARWLTLDRVPPGASVALRGLALTAIDAILALTEGRGGRFVAGASPSGLRYVTGRVPDVTIFPYSRSGRPMRPKPNGTIAAPIERRLAGVVAAAAAQIPTDPDGPKAVTALVRSVGAVADAVLAVGGAAPAEHDRLDDWCVALTAGAPGPSDRSPAEELARGYAVAVGAMPFDAEAALGLAWRLLYSAVVKRFSGAPLGPVGWAGFRALAAELERVGFGPSPENIAKLVALVDAGVVVLDHTTGGRLVDREDTTELHSDAGSVAVGCVVDAVLPGPGVDRDGETPLERLVAAGAVTVAVGQRGVQVDPVDASASDADGRRIPGLAAVGRHTEDATIGNDTLNRALHPQVDRWAARVVGRAASAGDGRATVPVAVGEDEER